MEKGVDISVWQDINSTSQMYDPWKTRAQGGVFVGIKASQGNFIDSDFTKNWANCKNVLYRMPYHFLVWNIDPKLQAEIFWNTVKNDLHGVLCLVCDFEWWQTTPANAMDILYNFMERLKQLCGNVPIGLYTAKSFWDVYGSKSLYWKQYKLWLCDIQGEVPVPYPWDKWTFHQYTFKLNGPLWGAESLDLDGDYYNGTLQDMIKEFNLPPLDGEIIVPEPPDTGFMMKCIKNVNVRTGPATSYPDVGDYYVGDLVGPVLDIGGGKSGAWIKIAEGRWVCVTDNYNNVYLKVEA